MTVNDSDIKVNSGSSRERTDKNSFVKNIILKIVLPAVLVILLVNLVFQGSKDGKPLDTIRKAKASGNYDIVCKEYEKLIQKDFFNLEYHREYLHSSLNLGRSDNYDDSLDAVKTEYVKYSLDKDVKVSDIGYYGLGYFYSIRDDFKNAFANFNQVKDGNLPYLNNSIGYAYLKSGDREKAKRYFYKEIEIKGNIEGAYSNLAQVLYEERDFSKLKELISDQKIKIFIPYRIIRIVNLKSGQTLSYIADFFNYGYVTSFGFAAAVLILIVWFNYLRRIDIFDSEKQGYLLITLLGGMFFAAICRVFYDIFDYGLRFELNGHIINDLLYCFLGIGLIEETVKVIPFLLILRFTRQINESIDYVIYASVSALGFAFMENLLYFQDPGLRAVTGRALMSVLLHMSMTTFAVYGLFYSRYRKNNQHKMLYFGLSFLTAVVVHGLFDFFLMVKGLPPQVKMLSILILAIAINKFSIIIKNALNVSEFNNEQKTRVESLSWYLVYSICAIVLCQYAVMGWKFGAANANMTMLKPIGLYYFLTIIIIGNLGRIEITKSKWIGFFERKNRLTKQEERVRELN